MNSKQTISLNEGINNPFSEDEIDIKPILSSLNRNKTLIAKYTLSSLILSSLIAFTSEKIWQGEFQIVLESQKSLPSALLDSNISNLVGLDNENTTLNTQVGILKSPSVLINIFEFVKSKKASKNNSSFRNLRFNEWKEKFLDISLEKNTKILNLAYRDPDKDLVLPVLNKISNTWN